MTKITKAEARLALSVDNYDKLIATGKVMDALDRFYQLYTIEDDGMVSMRYK